MANPPTAGNAKKIGRRGRKRRVAGWTLLLLGLLVAGVWVASRSRVVTASGGLWRLSLENGRLEVTRFGGSDNDPGRPWEFTAFRSDASGFQWNADKWFGYHGAGPHRSVNLGTCAWYGFSGSVHSANLWLVALWPIPLLLWTPAALLLRSGILARRRATQGMCAKCGYSLAGLASDAPCPECGKKAKATA